MNKILMCLLALILVVPAWAVESEVAPANPQPEAKKTVPAATTATTGKKTTAATSTKATTTSNTTGVCPTGCVQMACPPPGGPVVCCHKTPAGFAAC